MRFELKKYQDQQNIETMLTEMNRAMEQPLFENQKALAEYARKLAAFGNVLVAQAGGCVVGFIAYYTTMNPEKMAYVTALAVNDRVIQKGTGYQTASIWLLLQVKMELEQLGFEGGRLEVKRDNRHAIQLYEKFGCRRQEEAEQSSNSIRMCLRWEWIPEQYLRLAQRMERQKDGKRENNKILSGMQPYLFPYLGYFQMIKNADLFLLSGDMQYMEGGWINRNRIYNPQKEWEYFTFSIRKSSAKALINQRVYANMDYEKKKLLKKLYQTYRRAANFEETYSFLEELLGYENPNVAEFNMEMIKRVAAYLEITTPIGSTDEITDPEFRRNFEQLKCQDRVIYICQYVGADCYVNPPGGRALYQPQAFASQGIRLQFLEKQCPQDLSIIDVMMHHPKEEIQKLLTMYELT